MANVSCHSRVVMNSEPQKVQRSRIILVAIGIAIATLFFIFRFTAATAFLVFVLLCFFYRLHPETV
jgi:hypothetical protein